MPDFNKLRALRNLFPHLSNDYDKADRFLDKYFECGESVSRVAEATGIVFRTAQNIVETLQKDKEYYNDYIRRCGSHVQSFNNPDLSDAIFKWRKDGINKMMELHIKCEAVKDHTNARMYLKEYIQACDKLNADLNRYNKKSSSRGEDEDGNDTTGNALDSEITRLSKRLG